VPVSAWSWSARRLGIASALGILVVGIVYVAVIVFWVILETTPSEPIGDPYLAVMEILTMLSVLALLGLMIAISCFADAARRFHSVTAIMLGSLAAGVSIAVHFVQLTAVRQLWHAGRVADYRLVWPSVALAVEYFVWDILVGLTLLSASFALAGAHGAGSARSALRISGALCLLGVAGPLSGRMMLQNVAVLGYAGVFPVAGALTARFFRGARPAGGAAT
jgi:hypothetical protein